MNRLPGIPAAALLLSLLLPSLAPATPAPPVVRDADDYRAAVKAAPSRRMVDLRQAAPALFFDLRYATSNNFTGSPLYPNPRAFLRAPAAARLREAAADLQGRGLGLKIFDAYRPYSATVRLWNRYSRQWAAYLAPPWLGSDHNRGVAVDLTLVDVKTGKELPMGTDFDAFTPKANQGCASLPAPVLANRALLRKTMESHGFHGFDGEWWHYSLDGAKQFPLLDLPPEAFGDSDPK